MRDALVAGRKTQIRRLVQPSWSLLDGAPVDAETWAALDLEKAWVDPGPSPAGNPGPYLKVPRKNDPEERVHRVYCRRWTGDRFFIQEAWRIDGFVGKPAPRQRLEGATILYAADAQGDAGWYEAISMPRWAARTQITIASVGVERLQEITEDDARSEGVRPADDSWGSYLHIDAFKAAWAEWARVAKGGVSWDVNPWIWKLEIARLEMVKPAQTEDARA